jgi:hypothetical protein
MQLLSMRPHSKRKIGVSKVDLTSARIAQNADLKITGALNFVKEIIDNRADQMSDRIDDLKNLGWNDAEIAEIIAVTSLNIFPNYFNKLNRTELDFPVLEE